MNQVINDTELAFMHNTKNEQALYTARLQPIKTASSKQLHILHAYGQTNIITNDLSKLTKRNSWMNLRFFEYAPVESIEYIISNCHTINGNGSNYFLANMDNGIFTSHQAQSPISPADAYEICIGKLQKLQQNTIRSYASRLDDYEKPITDKYDLFDMTDRTYQNVYLNFIMRYKSSILER